MLLADIVNAVIAEEFIVQTVSFAAIPEEFYVTNAAAKHCRGSNSRGIRSTKRFFCSNSRGNLFNKCCCQTSAFRPLCVTIDLGRVETGVCELKNKPDRID